MDYENNCEKPKYNIKDNANLTQDPGTSTFVRLSPERFHKLTTGKKNPTREELEKLGADFHHEEDVKKAMCKGEPMDTMFLDYNQDKGKITGHEGRMRAEAAKDVMRDRQNLPVKIYCKGDDPRKQKCEISSGLDLMRKAEPQSNINEMERFNE